MLGKISSRSNSPGCVGQRSRSREVICVLLVILLEVDTLGIPGVKFECDGPRSVYMDRVARRVEPKQSVKVEAWQVHIFRNRSSRESIQPAKNARLETSVNL